MVNPTKNQKKDTIIKVLDILLILYFILLLVIIIGGGFSFSLLGLKVKAHTLKNPSITFVFLLILRKIINVKERFRDFLLVKLLQRLIKLLERAANQPSLLYVFMAGYALLMSITTVLRHISYNTQAYDLGIFDQVLWNAAHGNLLYSSILGGRHFFSEHISPILFLLAPLYWIYADPKVLLIVQSCVLATGAIPIYWLARKKLASNQLALIFSSIYLCYQPLRNVNLGDFHPIALTTPLLLFAFFYLDQKKYLIFGLFLMLAVLCKEEISLIVFIFGVYLAIAQKKRKLGIMVSLLGIAIFALDIWVIIPYYRRDSFAFVTRYSYLGDSIPEIIKTLLLHPVYVIKHVFIPKKIEYFVEVFGPTGFLSFLSPSHLLLAVPTFFQNVLSDFHSQYSIYYQYTAPLTPFVFISAICGLQNLLAKINLQSRSRLNFTKNQVIQAISVVLLFSCFTFYEALPIYKLTERTQLTDKFIRLVPPSASVSAQELYVPHLSHRSNIYLFPTISGAKYVFLDIASGFKGPVTEMEYFEKLSDLLEEDYGVLAMSDNLIVLKRGHSQLDNDKVPRIRAKGNAIFIIDGAILPSKTGRVDGTARIAKEGIDQKEFVTHGPYFRLPKGKYTFTMAYATHNIQADKKIGEWDIGIVLEDKFEIVKKGPIISVDGADGAIVQEVIISEAYTDFPVEFRSYYGGSGDLAIKNITIINRN